MFTLYNLVVSIVSKGIKIDAILVSESKEELEKLFPFDASKIGGIKFESGKSNSEFRIRQIENEPFEIKKPYFCEVPINNEYDTIEFRNIFDEMIHDDNNCMHISGKHPGCGKTTVIKNYCKGRRIVFATPGNKLAQVLRREGFEATTVHKLIGIFGDGREYSKMKPRDVSSVDFICFDEIMMHSPIILHRIHEYIQKHPTKRFFSTGDTGQLQPIGEWGNNVVDRQAYLEDCVNQIMQHKIHLKIPKRLKSEEQRKKLDQLKKDVFDLSKDVLTTLKSAGFKSISKMSDVKTTQNICYFNFRTKQVNGHVHRNLIKPSAKAIQINGVKYWPGLELVYRGSDEVNKTSKTILFKNYNYEIKSISSKSFTIRDIEDDALFTFPIGKLSQFILPYANTCHSIQGLNIDGPLTIFDLNAPHVDRFFVWTALTRATDFSNITVFEHSEQEIVSLSKSLIRRFLEEKVIRYKYQDKIAGRKFKPCDFISAEWINDAYNALGANEVCCLCNEPYETIIVNGKVVSNLTVDRIDNSLAHLKSNCRLCCRKCNCARSNHY